MPKKPEDSSLTKEERDFARTIRVPNKERAKPKPIVMKHIKSINAPGILHETVSNMSLMELSAGNMAWYENSDLEDIPNESNV